MSGAEQTTETAGTGTTEQSTTQLGGANEQGTDVEAKGQSTETGQKAATEETGDVESKSKGKDGEHKDGEGNKDASIEYGEFVIPEGVKGIVTEEKMEEFKAFGQTNRLSQEQMQALLNYDAARTEAAQQAHTDMVAGWVDAVEKDSELGGERQAEALKVANSAMKAFASEALQNLLEHRSADNPDGWGLGDHPEVIRFFYKVGLAMQEDKSGVLNKGAAVKSRADTFYDGK